MTIPGGLVVMLDGIDGVGKTTQVKLASEALGSEGYDVHTVRNLGGTPIGEALRDVMLSPIERPPTTNLYISVAIQEALVEAVDAARAEGKLILMDRGPLSLAAYQAFGSGVDPDMVWPYVEAGMTQLKPELTILYHGDIPTAIERARHQSGKADYFEDKDVDFFKRVETGFEATAKRFETISVDANRAIADVQADTLDLIRSAIKTKHKQL